MSALASMPRSERGPDGSTYQVRRLRSAEKEYTCPGCLRPIPTGSPHVVAWPDESAFGMPQGVEARRHWHSECWRRGLRPS
ncbi:hypothetical protein [Actinomyces mediterranea]|uniref:hypothetical protein n=1 Tax=Actinomyces mediterranea TaxID=1871028 RepID=UPI000970433A